MEEIFYNVFKEMPRQGPGSKESTLKALGLLPNLPHPLNILDVGCGTGNQTLHLAGAIKGEIIAIDNYKPFVDKVNAAARAEGLGDIVEARVGDMYHLDLPEKHFDIIWSEGALYIMGLNKALNALKKHLKPGGYFVVSDFNFFTIDTPKAIYDYFTREVLDAGTPEQTIKMIEDEGYILVNHFALPKKDWDYFYNSEEEILSRKREQYAHDAKAIKIIDEMQYEIDIYREYPGSYGYVFYIIQLKS